MYEHIVTINADKYTAVDEEGLVTGKTKVLQSLNIARLKRVSFL